jgi:poly(3-hydroxyalkanoate) synthetase
MSGHPSGPGPLLRRGPRPLMLHLILAMLRSHGLPNALPNWSGVSPNATDPASRTPRASPGRDHAESSKAQATAEWTTAASEALSRFAADLASGAIPQSTPEAFVPHRALIAGIAAYRRHPWQRTLPDPPEIWREGGSRLLDYGAAQAADDSRPVLLVVPSLVNQSYVLDLMPGRSMLRWLATQGIRPLLLDWGWPGPVERRFTLTDYIAGRLERALVAVRAIGGAGRPPLLAGYCMGGLLAVAAAQRRRDLVSGLALLATPWDFHADDDEGSGGGDGAARARARSLARTLPFLEPAMALTGTLPVDLIQVLFAMLDPAAIADKFRSFSRLDPRSERARRFVALEDWLNDGIPLAAPVARETLGDWYGENTPARGEWRVAGLPVDPSNLALPAFVAIPGRDRIVPPASAAALASLLPGAAIHRPAAGHVGMTAGATAESVLWRPLRDWIVRQ